MTHANAPLSVEGCRPLIERRKKCPTAHVAVEMGISLACASKWVDRSAARSIAQAGRRGYVYLHCAVDGLTSFGPTRFNADRESASF